MSIFTAAISSISVCGAMIFTIVCSFATSSENINISGIDMIFQQFGWNDAMATEKDKTEYTNKKWSAIEARDECISALHFHRNWNIVKLKTINWKKNSKSFMLDLFMMCNFSHHFPYFHSNVHFEQHRKAKNDWHQSSVHFSFFRFLFVFLHSSRHFFRVFPTKNRNLWL